MEKTEPRNRAISDRPDLEGSITPAGEEFNYLNNALSEMGDTIDYLEKRLGVVLSNSLEEGKDTAGTPEQNLSALPSEIRRHRHSVNYYNQRLGSIISRLEI